MKKTSVRIFIFMLLLALGACKKDGDTIQKENTFSVKVTQNITLPYIVTSKEAIVFDLSIVPNSPTQIKSAVLSLDENDLQSATASGAGEISLQYTYAVQGRDIGKSLIFRLTILDEAGRIVDKDFTVYVQSAPADVAITIPSDAPSEIKDDESVDFDISIVSENDLKYIKTFLDHVEITELTKETFASPKEDTYHFSYQPTVADADKTLIFTIEVMDILGNIVKQEYALRIERSVEADFNFFVDVNLGAQLSTVHGPFFNASNGEVYQKAGSAAKSADIDLVNFYSGSTNAYNITSPTFANVANVIYTVALYGDDGIPNWPVRKQTLIKKITMTREEFDLIASGSEIESLYTGSAVVESETSGGVANGNVLVFKTQEDKYGVVYAKSRSGNSNSSYLILDIKVQK